MLRHLITSTLVVGCLLVPSVNAQKNDRADQPRKANDRQNARIPSYLQSVKLTKDQESKIRDVVRKHREKSQEKWQQFYKAHWEAVQLEAALRAVCTHEDKGSSEERKGATFEKPERNKGSDSKGTAEKQQKDDEDEIIVMRMLMRRPNGQVREVVLFQNPKEEKAGEQPAVLKEYQTRLQGARKQVHQLHNELVQMQSQRMVAIEQILTKDQCEQLRGTSRTQPEGSKRKRDKKDGGK